MNNSDLVRQLWSLCNILRDDGITYHQYVNELTYLLFLKMAEETKTERELPPGFRWNDLARLRGSEQFDFYRRQLVLLGTEGTERIRAIFANPTSLLRNPESLNLLVSKIDQLDWFRARQEGLGDLYEGLLEKNASEKKSGAGQYFTPRALIDSMVAVMKPKLDDIIQDPAAGTGGFLVAANRYINEHSDPGSWSDIQKRKHRTNTFFGMEHVQDTFRLALMNLLLHNIESEPSGGGIRFGDTLSPAGQSLPPATLFLTNPPFGTKSGGGLPTRTDLPFPTSNKQFCFLQHIYGGLLPGGRAAVVLPDNVLFESNVGRQIRTDLMNKCRLHTILRLPTGIFYAQGVNTNVLYFTRGESDVDNTDDVWVYDLRAGMPPYGKRTQFVRDHLAAFELAFGDDPTGTPEALARRIDTGENGRFRRFSREFVARRDDDLDIAWLQTDKEQSLEDEEDPSVIALAALQELQGAVDELRAVLEQLGEDVEEL